MKPRTEWTCNPEVINDDSVYADNGSNVTVIKRFVKEHTEFLLGIFMAISLVEGAFLWTEWHHKEQQSDLAIYELHDFQSATFNPLLAQVKSDHDLIQSYGLSKTISETCNR